MGQCSTENRKHFALVHEKQKKREVKYNHMKTQEEKDRAAERAREKYHSDPEHRAKSLERSKAYRIKHPQKMAEHTCRWRAENKDKTRAYKAANREAVKAIQDSFKARNPEKYAAWTILRNALAAGKVVKGVCEQCGAVKVEGHHDDYTKPLEVRWLCKKHHVEHHRLFKAKP